MWTEIKNFANKEIITGSGIKIWVTALAGLIIGAGAWLYTKMVDSY